MSPKDYWNILNGSAEGKKVKSKVSIETFLKHFKDLSVTKPDTDHPEDSANTLYIDPLLNKVISPDEVLEADNDLKFGKASALDGVRNEYLDKPTPELLELIWKIFNKILDTGFIPKQWAERALSYLCTRTKAPPLTPQTIVVLRC